ncbi:heparinase II/III domain-containing protein [Puniceicoccus vermicola]|uniref:Heparinase II/III family protein n=1 Tax=Puniceicoccus vermicola TaxID=388746 RepID=A0A7X1B0X9_9BACT|nr:heparinase II/III family protein [Puniceicoccus vermicola]MBC2603429.1 heparinase II/III family protein [Puniceicoccus vermicola]
MPQPESKEGCINLLEASYSKEKLLRILENSQGKALLPPADHAIWRNARYDTYFKPLIALAEQEAEQALPELTNDLYAEFHRSGNRSRFETVYFERRRRIARAAIAYLRLDHDTAARERMGRSLIEKLEALGEDESWAVPAHVESTSGKDPFQIDLFGGETASLVAELLVLFNSLIPRSLTEKLRQRIETQFFDNYLERHEEFWWTKTSNNWNAVCHQGVVGAALLLLKDTAKLAEILNLSCHYLNTFIGGFADDGGCSEGPIYWSYGFGWFSKLNAQLEARSDGRLSLFEGSDKIQKIARFGSLMTLPGDCLVNFADCPSKALLRPSVLTYLGERLQDPLCLDHGRRNYRKLLERQIELNKERSDFFLFSDLLLRDPGAIDSGQEAGRSEDIFLKDLNVTIAHSHNSDAPQWHFAAKGGHNDESHNHNDCGSYILNIGEIPMIQEIGTPEYNKDYFDPKRRHEYLAARTKGHSLAVINGQEQAAGAAFHSEILGHLAAEDELQVTMDLTQAYPVAARCRRYRRTFRFHQGAPFLEVTDEFDLESVDSLESAVITNCSVQVLSDRAVLSHQDTSVALVPLEGTRIQDFEHLSFTDHHGAEAHVHRIRFSPVSLDTSSRIAYRVIPTASARVG